MPITYQQEPLFKVLPDLEDLARQDWEEMYHDKDNFPFNPDWELYQKLEDAGIFLIFTVRSDEQIVGYFSVIVGPSLHSKGNLVISNDVIYLHPDYRKGGIGIGLFKFVEKCLKEDGHNHLHILASEKYNIDKLLTRLGYKKIESKYEKRLS